MKRTTGLLATTLLVLGITAMPATAQQRGPSGDDGSYNCPDFDTQDEAQDFFEAEGGPEEDPNNLDRDDDGVACEALPGGPDEGVNETGEDPGQGVDRQEELNPAEGDDGDDGGEPADEEPADEDDTEEMEAPTGVEAGTGGLVGGMPLGVVVVMLLGFALTLGGAVQARRR
jgi:hypothetical protein